MLPGVPTMASVEQPPPLRVGHGAADRPIPRHAASAIEPCPEPYPDTRYPCLAAENGPNHFPDTRPPLPRLALENHNRWPFSPSGLEFSGTLPRYETLPPAFVVQLMRRLLMLYIELP